MISDVPAGRQDEYHKSVLLQEIVDFLAVSSGKLYIDATLGGGGHTLAILKHGGLVLGIDQDKDAVEYVRENLKAQISSGKLKIAQGNFRDIDKIAHSNGFGPPAGFVAGILFDLGVSTHQIESPERGFSFMQEAPLDMRMDKSLTVTAADLINGLSKNELYELFTKFGEEFRARAISNIITGSRRISLVQTTEDLVALIARANGMNIKNLRPIERANISKRVFQALRIVVNDEFNSLKEALDKSYELLFPGGRLVVISFHSLEDRIVKEKFVSFKESKMGSILTKSPITPAFLEIEENRRARSAKLRVFEKMPRGEKI